MTKTTESISVVIPFKDSPEMTVDCVKSLYMFGGSLINQVLLVSNNSSKDSLQAVRTSLKDYKDLSIVEYNKPFNYQKINNWAIEQTKSDTVLMLNNDTELVEASKGLLEVMYKKAQEPHVGIVGCLLLYGDKKYIQHAGVYLEPGGLATHYFQREVLSATKQHIKKDRPLTAVTGAACMIRKDRFIGVGGFNEDFIIGGGDVDLCLRLNAEGFQTWYISGGDDPKYILHKESISRKGIRMPYTDFYNSYLSYVSALDKNTLTDPYIKN